MRFVPSRHVCHRIDSRQPYPPDLFNNRLLCKPTRQQYGNSRLERPVASQRNILFLTGNIN